MEAITATTDLTGRVKSVASYNFAENAGSPAAARVLLRNGGSSGTIYQDVRIAASSSVQQDFSRPLLFPSGLYVDVTAGTVRGGIS